LKFFQIHSSDRVSVAASDLSTQIMIPHRFEKFMEDIVSSVTAGKIPMSRIDDAVGRTLRVKFISGVFDHPFSNPSLLNVVGCKVTCACLCLSVLFPPTIIHIFPV
jgi:beta-glucosidase-like glycosyl hydrolase